MEKKLLNRAISCAFDLPDTVSALQKGLVYNNELEISANVKDFIIRDLSELTESQAKCQEWSNLQQSKITATIFHFIFAPVNTLQKKPDEVTGSLFETIIGVKDDYPTKEIKHGRTSEPHVKKKCRLKENIAFFIKRTAK